jgi:hypothetical protein
MKLVLPVPVIIGTLRWITLMHVHARVVPLSSHMVLLWLMHHRLTLVGVRIVHRVRLTLWDHVWLVGVLVARTSEFTGILQNGSLVR